MTLKEQLYVCTLARCQTITKASEELCITQSALSSYISNLEKYLGTKLFDRTEKRFALTSVGEEYVKRAEIMLRMKEEFDELLEQDVQRKRKTVRIGLQVRRAIILLPYIYTHFPEKYSNVHLVFEEASNRNLNSMYQAGKLDMMIGIDTGELQDSSYIRLGKEYILMAVHRDNPVIKNAWQEPGDPFLHMDLEAVKNETFVLPYKYQALREQLDNMFQTYQIHPQNKIEARNFDTMAALVNENVGIAFNRSGYLPTMKQFEHIRYFMIGKTPYSSQIVLACRPGIKNEPYVKELFTIIREAVSNADCSENQQQFM